MEEFVGITLDVAKHKLKLWLEVEDAVATGQSYKIGSRTLTRADLSEVRKQIDYWQSKYSSLSNGSAGRRVVRVVCRDR